VRLMATGDLVGPPAFGRVAGSVKDGGATGASISDNGACLSFHAGGHTASGLGDDRRLGTCTWCPGSAPAASTPSRWSQLPARVRLRRRARAGAADERPPHRAPSWRG